jgi:hypothetical protein
MKPLTKRILKHGLMAAIPLAVLGWLFAQMAGMWTAAQSPVRIGPMHDAAMVTPQDDGKAITELFEVRVPLVLATGGFLFVATGELLMSLWRPRTPAAAARQTTGTITPTAP